jgi:hypothetical protein
MEAGDTVSGFRFLDTCLTMYQGCRMSKYAIAVSHDEVAKEYNVVLHGPGLGSEGRPYVFISAERCATFVEAVNFAYQQGLRDNQRSSSRYDGRFWVVTGATPEDLAACPEGWASSLKRRWRAFLFRQ